MLDVHDPHRQREVHYFFPLVDRPFWDSGYSSGTTAGEDPSSYASNTWNSEKWNRQQRSHDVDFERICSGEPPPRLAVHRVEVRVRRAIFVFIQRRRKISQGAVFVNQDNITALYYV
jgi:hypothetical protein